MKFIEMKEAIKPLLERFYGISDSEAEEMIIDDNDTLEGRFLNEIYEQMAGASIEGLAIGDKDFSINVSQTDEDEYLMLLTFGGCTDVNGARIAMFEYEQSSWSVVLGIENEVESEGDTLVLSCSFIAKNGNELRDNLSAIFEVLQNEEYEELLHNVLVHFE